MDQPKRGCATKCATTTFRLAAYAKEENKILREKLGTKRILRNDSQRMRLARLGKQLGRSVLADACCIFSPDTILRWHARLVARKYGGSKNRKPGSKRISEEVEQLIGLPPDYVPARSKQLCTRSVLFGGGVEIGM